MHLIMDYIMYLNKKNWALHSKKNLMTMQMNTKMKMATKALTLP